ncbi:DUF6477 family protein [Sinirhodobacter sp. WL0062]|uniref:DUF6477 family protein n=1 Tax=Rhodobacter flavimaris TaxID=2907145 RepID=A0ABS8YQY4_9RHOB|nr:DUF6477 family protein [Sinirhodobacter sp. WL0062]MCE5972299.1 DUF6477 family protein [Sinirhodobacter sp. WL0062]
MTELATQIAALRRPRLLIRAARFGQRDYSRARDLRRLMRVPAPPAPEHALARLLDEEARLEAARQEGDAAYNISRHVDLLIAVMAEARLLPQTPVTQPQLSAI